MNSSLRHAFSALRKARLIGYASACFCLLASLLVLDGLQALMREDFNHLDIIAGERVPVSGAMPLDARDHTQILWDIDGNPGLRFMAEASFKGFWMGALMWRGELAADSAARPGAARLTIHDMVPAKSATNSTMMVQNPAQVYSITVWPTEAAFQAARFSLVRRLTGFSAFVFAALSVIGGIACGAVHAVTFHKARQSLAAEGLFCIHAAQRNATGLRAVFSPEGREDDLHVGQAAALFDNKGNEAGQGVISECGPQKCSVLFPEGVRTPPYGWFLRCAEKRTALENTPRLG